MFRTRSVSSALVALLCGLCAAFSCQSDTPTTPDNTPVPPATELRVEAYVLGAGERAEFSSNFEIIATDSVVIDGDIVVRPDQAGDFTIRCTQGDIDINGSVLVEAAPTGPSPVGQPAAAGAAKQHATPAAGDTELPPGAVNNPRLFFIVDSPGATICITNGAILQSGNGADALDESIVSAGGQQFGSVGAPGGDIIVRALGGQILLQDMANATRPVFILGNGGRGANVYVDRANFQASGTTLDVVAGRGGDSGILMLEAGTIQGIPAPEDLPANVEILGGGCGGAGGYAMWNNVGGELFTGDSANEETYALQSISFRGGRGGNGAVAGGPGGFAAYWSMRVVNDRGEPIASASVTGGDGGDVFASPVPVGLATGGEGGEYMVWGNNGWAGASEDDGGPIHGAQGGDASGRGGNGGHVNDDVMFQSAIGGDGGNSEVAQSELDAQLRAIGYDWGAVGLAGQWPLFVVGGFGGAGASSECNGCPGGDGGGSGAAVAVGGDGGNVPDRAGARGGRGGDVWEAVSGLPDSLGTFLGDSLSVGGDGNPPGDGGCSRAVLTSPGSGGSGFIPGDDGVFLNLTADGDDTRCWPDGAFCGGNTECKDDSTGGGGDCWTTAGATCTARYYLETAITHSDGSTTTSFLEWVETATLEDLSRGWQVSGTYSRHDTTWTYEVPWNPYNRHDPPAIAATIRPLCYQQTGTIYAPGIASTVVSSDTTNGVITTSTVVRAFAGCNPVLFDQSDPNGWTCCFISNQWRPVFTDGELCP